MSSGSLRLNSGFLATVQSSPTPPPKDELDITVLYAKTNPLGVTIPAATWQQDADPIFYWDPPAGGLPVAGYSYALDATPDDVIETTLTYWDVAQDPLQFLADGQHTFSVKAIASSGLAGNPASFAIWVDTTPPTIGTLTPPAGSLVNTLAPLISVALSDVHSGVDPAQVILTINGTAVSMSFDPASGTATASGAGPMVEGPNTLTLDVKDDAGNAQVPLVWSLTADVTPPAGSVLINAGAPQTTTIYVTLNLTASDAISGVASMLLSNDPTIGYVSEPFSPVRDLWALTPVSGTQTVYVKFVDGAGNISAPVQDDILLELLAPDTLILSGPAGITPDQSATFTYTCSDSDCVFSYSFDNEPWSDWSSTTTATKTGLVFGNHYFRVKAAKEVNGTAGIQLEEEDPTPAERTWIVGVQQPGFLPQGPPVKLWRVE